MNKKEWVVYLVRCADESLYCGITNDIERRLVAHNSGKGAKYTKSRMPVDDGRGQFQNDQERGP